MEKVVKSDFNFSKILIISIFFVLFILIIFLIGIFFSENLGKAKNLDYLENIEDISLREDARKSVKCLTGEIQDNSCRDLFLKENIIEICNNLKSEMKNNCFYEAATVNNKEEYCYYSNELSGSCEEEFA